MRIGFVPVLVRNAGGVYQYCLTMLEALRDPDVLGAENEIVIVAGRAEKSDIATLRREGWEIIPMQAPSVRRRIGSVLRQLGLGEIIDGLRVSRREQVTGGRSGSPDDPRHNSDAEAWFRANGLELLIFPVPMSLAFECGLPYVFMVHDLQHRLQPQFPEVSANGEWERREYLFRNGVRSAELVVIDSEAGKEDVMDCYGEYGITAERIHTLPFLPGKYLDLECDASRRARVRQRYDLAERFFFYPAQFWPHKNHARIVEAVAWLRNKRGIEVTIAFAGSHFNEIRERTFAECMDLIEALGLSSQVRYLGYVADEDLGPLYSLSEGLVMPTFFGPTNLPVTEAWQAGCPVLTSDIRGIREHAGDAALLVDPGSTEALAEGMARLWTDDRLRQTLRERGRSRLAEFSPHRYKARLGAVIADASRRVTEGPRKPEFGLVKSAAR